MRAVVVVVHRVAVVVRKVVSVNVVHEAVAVVIDAVAGNLARIGPDVGGQVGMAVVDAGVDHAHNDRAAARRDIPSLWGVDVGIDRAPRLPDVVESVELRERWIIGCRRDPRRAVAAERGDSHVGGEILLHGAQRRRGSHEQLPWQAQPFDHLDAQRRSLVAQRCGLLKIGSCLRYRVHAFERPAGEADDPFMHPGGV